MAIDCNAPADINEWTSCNAQAVITPVTETVELAVGVSISLAVTFAGVLFVRKVVREFGR